MKFVDCTYEEACVALVEGYKIRNALWDIGYYLQLANGVVFIVDTISNKKNRQLDNNLNPKGKYQKEVIETIMTIAEIEKALGIKYLKIVKDK